MVGGGAAGAGTATTTAVSGGVGSGALYRNVQSNGNVSRGSTLERPAARSAAMLQSNGVPLGHHHQIVTTTADVEQQQHQRSAADPRIPVQVVAAESPYQVYDTNQVRIREGTERERDRVVEGMKKVH